MANLLELLKKSDLELLEYLFEYSDKSQKLKSILELRRHITAKKQNQLMIFLTLAIAASSFLQAITAYLLYISNSQ